jgi:hypothetical protein
VSEQAVPQPEPTEEDVNTTPPNPQIVDGTAGWKMPEPVFRKTSGYLPQGYEKRFSQDEIRTSADDNDSTAEMPVPELDSNVEPQPELGEHADETFAAETAAVAPAPKKSSAARLFFVIFGLLLALGLIVVAVAAVYLFYLMPNSDGTF